MADSPVIAALVAKRSRMPGAIAELNEQIQAIRGQIAQIDACLKIFGYEGDPRTIVPIRTRGEPLFARGQLLRMVLNIRRDAGGAAGNRQIATAIIAKMGWDQCDAALLARMTEKVKDVTKRYPPGDYAARCQ